MSEGPTPDIDAAILSLASSAQAAEDLDSLHLLAGAFNLYIEAQRRLQLRAHLSPDDLRRVFAIHSLLIEAASNNLTGGPPMPPRRMQ